MAKIKEGRPNKGNHLIRHKGEDASIKKTIPKGTRCKVQPRWYKVQGGTKYKVVQKAQSTRYKGEHNAAGKLRWGYWLFIKKNERKERNKNENKTFGPINCERCRFFGCLMCKSSTQ